MGTKHLLIVAMAEWCREVIAESADEGHDLPESLQPSHLVRMCDRIEERAEDWPVTKLHRWIGFVQGGMLANRILDLDGAKAMFDAAKNAFGSESDRDLIDHLDLNSTFQIDIGGEV